MSLLTRLQERLSRRLGDVWSIVVAPASEPEAGRSSTGLPQTTPDQRLESRAATTLPLKQRLSAIALRIEISGRVDLVPELENLLVPSSYRLLAWHD